MSAVMPRMAATYAFNSEPYAFGRPMKGNRIHRVLGTRRIITTM